MVARGRAVEDLVETGMRTKVSDLIARFLVHKNVPHVFGIVGSANAHIFDSICQAGVEMVCVHHEQAACMAVQTYYRDSGTVTAAVLTAGPGTVNGITGVVSAWADSIPCLIIVANEQTRHAREDNPLRMWGVQGVDGVAMVQNVTKYAVRVTDPTRILYELEKAYHIATSGRPGPCWIDVPMDVQSAIVDETELAEFEPEKATDRSTSTLPDDVRAVREALAQAKRPVIWLGHGIRLAGAMDELASLMELVRVPYLVSWAGIDMVDSNHPLMYGRAGVYGQRAANFVLQNADCLLAVGTRLAIPQVGYDITELVRGGKIMVVDIDSTELEKYADRYDLAVLADAKIFLRELLALLPEIAAPDSWIAKCDDYRNRYPWVAPEHRDTDGFINSYAFMDRLSGHLKDDQVIVTDMGTALLSGHQALRIRQGQRLMTSTGLGEMGYGLPAAIGASFARNRGEVLCLNCDGGMMMNLQEIQTIVHHQLPIKLIIFNNDGYLMIKHTQKAILDGRYSGTDRESGVTCPDFSAIAKAFGMEAFQIRTWEDFDSVVPLVQSARGPVICEVFMHPEQPFSPKLSLSVQRDGTLISPPIEDLSPFLPREELRSNMLVPVHPKSEAIEPDRPNGTSGSTLGA
jgi:acetolactate synthase I/II/III large subunit